MEKIIKIGDRNVPVRSTAAALIRYKANFGHDAIRDLIVLSGSMPKTDTEGDLALGESFDFDVFTRFLWVFAKSADGSIPPLEEWLDGFEIPPLDFLQQVFPQITDLLATTIKSEIKAKKK